MSITRPVRSMGAGGSPSDCTVHGESRMGLFIELDHRKATLSGITNRRSCEPERRFGGLNNDALNPMQWNLVPRQPCAPMRNTTEFVVSKVRVRVFN